MSDSPMDVEQDHPHPAPDESSSFAPQQQQQQRTSHAAAAAALAASAVPNSAGTEGTSGATNKEQQRPLRIAVHPLSIVSMADQYTRIVTGGSPLDVAEPVVGLLFGTTTTTSTTTTSTPSSSSSSNNKNKNNSNNNNKQQQQQQLLLRVTDAEDVPVNRSDAAATQINLHQAVFPHHQVVGWYRVVASTAASTTAAAAASGVTTVADASTDAQCSSPTPEDLMLSLQLAQHYYHHAGTEKEKSSTNNNVPFLFALFQVKSEDNNDDDHDDDDDDKLPFALFAVNLDQQVLVGLDNDADDEEDDAYWTLETALPERIAVERVMREPPAPAAVTAALAQALARNRSGDNSTLATSTAAAAACWGNNVGRNSDNNNNNAAATCMPLPLFVTATTPLLQSVSAIQERAAVLEQFLVSTQAAAAVPTAAAVAAATTTTTTTTATVSAVGNADANTVPPHDPLLLLYDHAMMRQIQGLLLHAGAMSATTTTSYNDNNNSNNNSNENASPLAQLQGERTATLTTTTNTTAAADTTDAPLLLQQLAVLAKTVHTVQQYTDKERAVHESKLAVVRTGRGGGGSFKTF